MPLCEVRANHDILCVVMFAPVRAYSNVHLTRHVSEMNVMIIFADGSPLREMHKEGYACVACSVLSFVYLSNAYEVMNVQIQSVNDVTLHPKTTANEVAMTPVVFITPHSKILCPDKPVIIELMKTTELLDHNRDKLIVPLFSNTDHLFPQTGRS